MAGNCCPKPALRHHLYIIVNHRDYPARSTELKGPPHADLDHNRGRGGPGADGPRGIRHEPHAEMARLIRIALHDSRKAAGAGLVRGL